MTRSLTGLQTARSHSNGLKPNSKILLLVNPVAGRKKRLRSQQVSAAQLELERAGMRVAIEEVGENREGGDLAREGVEQGVDLIIVCGGDGTINYAIQGMVHSQVPLAILPGGTANMLARQIGMPLSIKAAAQAILTSSPRRISLGCAAGRFFISLAGMGFDARVVRNLSKNLKNSLGIGSYVIEAFWQLFLGARSPLFLATANGKQHKVSYVCVSKSQYFGHLSVLPEADLFSNQFYLYGFQSQSRLRYLHYGAAILADRKASLPAFIQFPTDRVECELINPEERAIYFQVDGEFAGKLPCSIEIVPDALTLLVPQSTQGFSVRK